MKLDSVFGDGAINLGVLGIGGEVVGFAKQGRGTAFTHGVWTINVFQGRAAALVNGGFVDWSGGRYYRCRNRSLLLVNRLYLAVDAFYFCAYFLRSLRVGWGVFATGSATGDVYHLLAQLDHAAIKRSGRSQGLSDLL